MVPPSPLQIRVPINVWLKPGVPAADLTIMGTPGAKARVRAAFSHGRMGERIRGS